MWTFVSAWYNLPFTILILFSIVLAAMQFIGLGGDADTDADVDADVDVDTDTDFNQDVDSDMADAPALTLLAFLGMGKAPLVVVLFLLLGSIGLLGWLINGFVLNLLGAYPNVAFFVVLPVTMTIAGLFSSRATRFMAWMLPPISTTATSANDLVGRRGTVISAYIDSMRGRVRVRDRGGTSISVFAVAMNGETIEDSAEVILISYDIAHKRYIVDRA